MNAIEPFIKSKSVVIWDWNGTLLDDVEMVHQTLCELLIENNLPAPCLDTHRERFRFPIQEYYSELGFDFGSTPYPYLTERFFQILNPKLAGVKLFDGVASFLEETKRNGITHYILSMAHEGELKDHIRELDIYHHFEAICGLGDQFAQSKIDRAKQLMNDFEISPQDALFIGDTDHDLEVGNVIGVDTLLIAQGHQSFERLSRLHHRVLANRLISPADHPTI